MARPVADREDRQRQYFGLAEELCLGKPLG
jgi:hypothetical protein